MVEQNQPEARRKSGFDQAPQILITSEAMSQHDRGTALNSGDPHVISRLQIHSSHTATGAHQAI
jgi:hypothetical protein